MSVQPPSPRYVGPAKWHGPATNKPINRIVIHATVGAEPGVDGAARSTVAGSKATTRPSSYHYVADAKESLQYVYDSVVAYHAPPNEHSIGYELCCSLSDQGHGHWERPDHQAMLKIVAKDVAQLCAAYDVPVVKLSVADLLAGKRGICGHIDISNAWHQTTHWDPGPFFPWTTFLAMVRAAGEPPKPPLPPPAVTFRAAHISGRWDAPPDSWRKALAIVAKDGASVATITETTRDGVLGGVLPDGWELARLDATPGQSECAVAWDADVWHRASDAYATQVATTTFQIHGHTRPPTTTICQPLTHKESGKVALFQALHAPSGVEGSGTFKGRRPGAVEAYTETADGVRKAWGVGWGRHPQAARIIGGDWNVSFRRRWVRDWWATTFPELASCWEKRRPILGTHGLRVIDGISVGRGKLNVTHARVLTRRAPKFDHRHVVVDVEWLP